MENVPFYAGITVAGDVPNPSYVFIDDILPYHNQPYAHLLLLDFLAQQGVTDFESVTLTSLDGGFVTVTLGRIFADHGMHAVQEEGRLGNHGNLIARDMLVPV